MSIYSAKHKEAEDEEEEEEEEEKERKEVTSEVLCTETGEYHRIPDSSDITRERFSAGF